MGVGILREIVVYAFYDPSNNFSARGGLSLYHAKGLETAHNPKEQAILTGRERLVGILLCQKQRAGRGITIFGSCFFSFLMPLCLS
jgi:hypothetical protein